MWWQIIGWTVFDLSSFFMTLSWWVLELAAAMASAIVWLGTFALLGDLLAGRYQQAPKFFIALGLLPGLLWLFLLLTNWGAPWILVRVSVAAGWTMAGWLLGQWALTRLRA